MRTVVVLPTYNEAENIVGFLRAVRQAAPDADILVVDDNSPDGTAALGRGDGAELGRIKVLRRPGKLGLGAAYRHGFTTAFDEGYEAIVSMDSDFSHDPAVIPTMLRLLADGADAVIGSRYVPGGATVDWPMRRRVLSRVGQSLHGRGAAAAGERLHVGLSRLSRRGAAGHRPGDHDR